MSIGADRERWRRVGELAALFLRIGITGFGGPAVTIAMMEDEVVSRRQWLSREYFLDLVGATNLIPGPNATEMAIHIGYVRAGWPGLITAGVCFILPAALITSALAWAYVRYGALPRVAPFLYGIKPAVLAVVFAALWRLGRSALKGWRLVPIGLAVIVASFLGMNEVAALLAGGIAGMLFLRAARRPLSPPSGGARLASLLALGALGNWGRPLQAISAGIGVVARPMAASASLWQIALFFLKVGSVLYGSGYVLVAFLQGGVVQDYGWLTQQQLLDAIAAGQFTPGPFLSTATFIGYLVAGGAGAVVATVAIFLPSFVFVALLNPIVPRLRRSPWTAAFLDAVNVSSLGLMVAVMLKLGRATLTDWPTWIIALGSGVLGVRWRVNSTLLVIGSAIIGWALSTWVV